MNENIPRPEYPRPQFRRKDWINLNGKWSFSFDFGRSGLDRNFASSTGFDREIIVPFCPESALSGIGYTDFIDSVWYHRRIQRPAGWEDKRILLHFGASDYETHVYIDGVSLGAHFGGSASFTFDISDYVRPGSAHNLVVNAKDDIRSATQPGGKQSLDYQSIGCFYTRVSGIWQTVWLEATSNWRIDRASLTPDVDNNILNVNPQLSRYLSGAYLKASIYDGEKLLAEEKQRISGANALQLKIEENLKVWSPQNPFLYDVQIEILSKEGELLDHVDSYVGMRKVHIEGNQLYLNNEPLYLRFVLDQGYYPEGVWTAPSDEDLVKDINLGLKAGFNGARLHQKVFEERFHYWADKLGYLTWAESPSWGLSMKSDASARNFLSEWREIMLRDINHPSIITWTPLNETWDLSDKIRHRRLHNEVYFLTKSLDYSRPVNGASGGCQVITDIYAVHIYEQNPSLLAQFLDPEKEGKHYATLGDKEVSYSGQPYIVDEFGGIKWVAKGNLSEEEGSWGYGISPTSQDEFYQRLEGQVKAILSLPHISGYCYTQLTDVEQEQNGLYSYDRSLKFNMDIIRDIFMRLPARRIS